LDELAQVLRLSALIAQLSRRTHAPSYWQSKNYFFGVFGRSSSLNQEAAEVIFRARELDWQAPQLSQKANLGVLPRHRNLLFVVL
jgi:hypothetical protein